MPATPESNSKKKDTGTMESPKSAKSPQVYAESSSFMDALFSSMGVPTARKKKRRLSESKDEKSPPAKAVKKDQNIQFCLLDFFVKSWPLQQPPEDKLLILISSVMYRGAQISWHELF